MLDKMQRGGAEMRSCSTCGRQRPGPGTDREVCRQTGSAECKTVAAERETRLQKGAGRLKYRSYW